ncbi:MAG: bifunctional diaminohydroxyphosphoribosylaminopyrimidine deaminase/5-amino-6-(5-phosphoribosylamino)uracil reductase RibD [Planctomycetaceae bacterium]
MTPFAHPAAAMQYALDLARSGLGRVEPNPPVGAAIVDEQLNLIAEGFHPHFGGPHAEIVALTTAGENARGRTLFVTLEPCCHHGKTGPCTAAIIAAGIKKVVVARIDPAAHAAGQGIARLKQAGIDVEVGLLEHAARKFTAPFAKWITLGLPYVTAKWAMSLDGKIATHAGQSQWISNARSRARVHELRGRMDGILVGIGTALADDPLLTARPAGPRRATRIIVDALARLPLTSKLATSAKESPVIVACTSAAPHDRQAALRAMGVEVLVLPSVVGAAPSANNVSLLNLLTELGRRGMTNVLIEGGGRILGSAFDADLIDEYHIFIAPKLIGGQTAPSPLAGRGLAKVPEYSALDVPEIEQLDGDLYIRAQTKVAVGR